MTFHPTPLKDAYTVDSSDAVTIVALSPECSFKQAGNVPEVEQLLPSADFGTSVKRARGGHAYRD
jgi:hypothetical protein